MLFLEERIQVICDQLKKFSHVETVSLTDWEYKKGKYLRPDEAEKAAENWEMFDAKLMHWYGPDQYYWFRTSFTVPESFDGEPLWLNVKTQIDEWDDGKNPQFLLFINDEIVQGLDMNHRRVLIAKEAKAGEVYALDLQSYTGTLHSEFRFLAEIINISEDVEGLYYDLQVPLWAFPKMEKDDANRHKITEIMNDTINLTDFRDVHSKEFYEGIRAAREHIKDNLYSPTEPYTDVIATCIGHSHIDVAWWWTVEETRSKVARSFATVLKLMEEYPDYKFLASQPVLYTFLKKRYPELYEKISEKVKEGRWEAEGGMWVEADCNLTSGESLVRQFVYGKKFFKDEFGVDNRILWLPDVFGYSGALPQIMKKSGIDYFMTTKLSWNQYNKVPYDTLNWEGIDGSRVLTHFISTLGVGQSSERFFTTYNGILHPDAIIGGWERYQQKDINNDILVAFGYGDGGGGPTHEMLETAKRMDKGVKGIPKVRQAFARDYFEELEEKIGDNKRLPLWAGEFYFEYHRGTYTSMARNKRSNRKSEFMLMDLEFLSVLANDAAYPKEEIDNMWKTVLINQFHDILPGTSIKEVYEVTKKEYAEVKETGTKLIKEKLKKVAETGDNLVVFNTLGFKRDDIVKVDQKDIKALKDKKGNIYPVQQTDDGGVVYLKGLPSKGYKSFEKVEDYNVSDSTFKIDDKTIETPFYKVKFNKNGFISSLYDKDNNREIFKKGAVGNQFIVYEDKPIYYDNWDIDMFYTEKFWEVDNLTSMKWITDGEVCATLKLEWEYSKSKFVQKITFYRNSRRIDFDTYADWKENQQLLKVHFPYDLNANEATFDIQFGNLTRETHTNTTWDKARFESCGQKWMDISEGGFGVSLLNDCKYGHSVDKSNVALTLIKSGIEPFTKTDQEEHSFTYALLPHAGTWVEASTVKEAYKLNQPSFTALGAAKESYSMFEVDCGHVILETIKKAEDGDGVILRFYDFENRRGNVKVKSAREIVKITETNLIEETVEEAKDIKLNGDTFEFEITPFEIKTLRINFK